MNNVILCIWSCLFLACSVDVLAQDSASLHGTDSSIISEKERRDIIISSAFKPTIRLASKILFLPDASSSIDSIPIRNYNYKLQFNPLDITHNGTSASIAPIGFINQITPIKKTQYLKFGYGLHQSIEAALHLDLLPKKQDIDIRLIGEYEQLIPSNDSYKKDYNANVGLLSRFYIKNKHELSFHYLMDALKVQSVYKDETTSPSTVSIPHIYQEFRLGFNNYQSPYNTKVYIAPQVSVTFFENNFDGLNHKQSEVAFFVRLPISVLLSDVVRLNIQAGYESFRFENQLTNGINTKADNFIFRGSANVQYFKDNINAYLGLTTYGSSKYNFLIFPEAFIHFGFGKASPFFIQAHFTTKQYYQTLYQFSELNPWIRDESSYGNILNMKSQASVQYNVKDRFNVRLSLEWNLYRDIKLVNNNFSDQYQLFSLLTEESLSEITLTNDYVYILPYSYEFGLTITKTFISSLTTLAKPYGRLYPLVEIYGLYHLLPRFTIKGSFVAYDKVFYQDENLQTQETQVGIYNFSAYLEYALLKKKKLRLWTEFTNILSQRYQRWNGYSHPGFILKIGASLYL